MTFHHNLSQIRMDAFTIISLVIMLVMVAVFLLRSRLLRLLHHLIKVMFPICIVFVLLSLFVPQVYTAAADWSLHQLGTYDTLVDFDEQIDSVLSAPQNLIGNIQELFGAEQAAGEPVRPLQRQVYPGLVAGLGLGYRLLCLILSLIGMGVLVYLSYTTASQTEVEMLKQRVQRLEQGLKHD